MASHKAGFVNIIGNPNVGKSTLMNTLVGEKISIITSKAQTTRHRIMGIVNGENYQIVYSDTPGLLKPAYKLQSSMMEFVHTALKDADVVLFVTDANDDAVPEEIFLTKLKTISCPIVLLINKVDISNTQKVEGLIDYWKTQLPKAEIIPASALLNLNVNKVFERIVALLPENPPYFDKDQFTDKTERFFSAEIIREKMLLNYHKEIPYSTEVVVDEYLEGETLIKIRASIIVERESQKGIVIGHKGNMLKKVGTDARVDIEAFTGKKVFLQLFVKVDKDWRNNEGRLRSYGYSQ